MTFKLVFLPPQRDTTRQWAKRLAETVPEANVVVPETMEAARQDVVEAAAAFGEIPPDLLALAGRLGWLQAPAIAPPAGYYYPELVRTESGRALQVTSKRGLCPTGQTFASTR